MLNLLFNTLLTITPHNTQKRRRRKERTTYALWRRYSRLVTDPVHNPDQQSLTWAPELKLNFIRVNFLGETAFLRGIFCLEYPSRGNEKVNCHFANYRLSFRKLQIFISQTTDSHFVSFPCFLVIFCVLLGKAFRYYVQCFLVKCFSGVLKVQTKFGLRKYRWVSRQDFVEHGGQVISATKQPEILHVLLVATNDLLSESPNSIFGTSFFLRETMNSLPGTNKLAFTGSDKWDSCIRVSKMKNT